ncbi:MAG: rod shape-determining protein MreC [bacterium]|nr:rod shape-determining protein MreC [bacterium]
MTNNRVTNFFIALIFISSLILIFNENLDYSSARKFFRSPIRPFLNIVDFIAEVNGRKMSEENLTLYLAEEMLQNQMLESLLYENHLLRSMLEFRETASYAAIPAEIIGGNQSDESKLVINKGTLSGVKEGMAVFFIKGIVGKTIECFEDYSIVETHSNINFKLGVCDRERKNFMIAYFYSKSVLKVESIQYDVRLNEGDTLFTSGFGNIYPPWLPVGIIFEAVKSDDGEMFYLLSCLENLSSLRFVFASEKKIEELPALFSENKKDSVGSVGWYRMYRRER